MGCDFPVLVNLISSLLDSYRKHVPSVRHQVHYLVRQLPDPVWHRHQDEEPVDHDWEGDEEGGVERTDGWVRTHGDKNCWYRPKMFIV